MQGGLVHVVGELVAIPIGSLVLALFVKRAFVVVEKSHAITYPRSYLTALAINFSAWVFTTVYTLLVGAAATGFGIIVCVALSVFASGFAAGVMLKNRDGYQIGAGSGIQVSALAVAASVVVSLIVMGVVMAVIGASAPQSDIAAGMGLLLSLVGGIGGVALIGMYRRASLTAMARESLRVAESHTAEAFRPSPGSSHFAEASSQGNKAAHRSSMGEAPQRPGSPIAMESQNRVIKAGVALAQKIESRGPTDESNESSDSNEELWAEAQSELIQGRPKAGLWARVFSESEGNEALAKARYLRERVRQLLTEQEHLKDDREKQRADEIRKAEEAIAQARVAKLKWLGTGSVNRAEVTLLAATIASDPTLIDTVEFMTGQTLLHTCVKEGWNEEALELVRKGADPARSNRNGQSAYALATDETVKKALAGARRSFVEGHG